MTEGNIPGTDWKNSYCIYCLDMLKTFQRKPKLFEFLGDSNWEELKIKNNITLQWLHFAMASLFNGSTLQWHDINLQWICSLLYLKAVCIYFISKAIYLCFHLFCLSMFTSKATIFLDDRLYQKILVFHQRVVRQLIALSKSFEH